MRRQTIIALAIIFVLALLSVAALSIPRFRLGPLERGTFDSPLGLTLGLDLKGGTHLIYETVKPNPTPEEMEGIVNIIRQRVDEFGVTEPLVQKQDPNRVLVQLPGVRDVQAAKNLIGAPADLDFREQIIDAQGATTWQKAQATVDNRQVTLTGALLVPDSATVSFDPQLGTPEVILEFNDVGGRAFQEISRRNLLKPLGIFLDDQLVSAPIIQAEIQANQRPRITGLDLEQARILAIQLNAGAFPTPLQKEPISQRDVDPTLGADVLEKGVVAGVIGFFLVAFFITSYYRLPGFLAAVALLLYAVFMLAIFKLVPVTLTLAGIAGLVLSIGMAIDANVLVFERLKEEVRLGRSLGAAMDSAFDRAWPAIRDSNLTTLITTGILFWFADRLGIPLVMGFAVTLFIGVVLSMFTALVVTRSFMRAALSSALLARRGFLTP
ncbi:MAG: protein translocase subunit SecD [Chloroflexi bacterium]|nr:protein translocase subunit SecD [Chloroflexota bacterium]